MPLPLLHFIRAAVLVGTAATVISAQQAVVPNASKFLVLLRSAQIGTEEIAVTQNASGWTITSAGRIGAPLELVTKMLQIRYDPEWKPIVTGYLGMLLMGGCFISIGLLISSLTKNQIVAGFMTFAVFLLLWVINWFGEGSGPTGRAVLSFLSITEHLDDFTRGIIDTKHVVYYLSFITFGLFLTAKSVDSERWRG